MVTLTPMMVAPACVLGPLRPTCTASVDFMQWSIVVVNEQGMDEEITAIRNSLDPSPPPKERKINSTYIFTFTRTSAQAESPFISTLYIDSVSIGLNETVGHCMDANNPMTSASTTINIIDVSEL